MARRVSTDTPLQELVLRKYEKPVELPKRDLVRRLYLSMGLLQPGDSRDIIVDIMYIFLSSRKKKAYTISELRNMVIGLRKQFKQPLNGIAESNIRRQVRRLKELYIVEKVKTRYRLTEKSSLSEIFEEKIQGFMLQALVKRVKEYAEEVDRQFGL